MGGGPDRLRWTILAALAGCTAPAPWADEHLVVRIDATDGGHAAHQVQTRLVDPAPPSAGCAPTPRTSETAAPDAEVVVELGHSGGVRGVGPALRGELQLAGADLRWRAFDVRRADAWGRTEKGLVRVGGDLDVTAVAVGPLGSARVGWSQEPSDRQVVVDVETRFGVLRCPSSGQTVDIPAWVARAQTGAAWLVGMEVQRVTMPTGLRVEAHSELAVELPVELTGPTLWTAEGAPAAEGYVDLPERPGGRGRDRTPPGVWET